MIPNPDQGSNNTQGRNILAEVADLDINPKALAAISNPLVHFDELITTHFPDLAEQSQIRQALMLMLDLHKDEPSRVIGMPSVSHPLEIARIIVEDFGVADADIVAAGLLSNAVEDQGIKLAKAHGYTGPATRMIEDLSTRAIAYDQLRKTQNERVIQLIDFQTKLPLELLTPYSLDRHQAAHNRSMNEMYQVREVQLMEREDVFILRLANYLDNFCNLQYLEESPRKEYLIDKYLPLARKYIKRIQEEDLHIAFPDPKPFIDKIEDSIRLLTVDHAYVYFNNGPINAAFTSTFEMMDEKQKQAMIHQKSELAAELHEEWRATRKVGDTYTPKVSTTIDLMWISINHTNNIDIANTHFNDLPRDKQASNMATSELAVNLVYERLLSNLPLDEEFIETGAQEIHNLWLERNKNAASTTVQKKPYSELPENEKEFDRIMLRKTIEAVTRPADESEFSLQSRIDEFNNTIQSNFNPEDVLRIQKAVELMRNIHEDQKYNSSVPYAFHPLGVAFDVITKFKITDPDLVIAALLHDVVEDQSRKLSAEHMHTAYARGESESLVAENHFREKFEENAFKEIEQQFGSRIVKIIHGLSNPDFTGSESEKNDQYKQHVQEAVVDNDVFVIKFADFTKNALSISNVTNPARRAHLMRKYGPVINEVFLPAFEAMSPDHPLYSARNECINELQRAYKEQYIEATEV